MSMKYTSFLKSSQIAIQIVIIKCDNKVAIWN